MPHDPEIDVKRLRLSPGDVVILTLPNHFTHSMAEHASAALKDSLRAAGHADVPVAIATNDVSISVLGHNEPGAMTTTGGGAPRHARPEPDLRSFDDLVERQDRETADGTEIVRIPRT